MLERRRGGYLPGIQTDPSRDKWAEKTGDLISQAEANVTAEHHDRALKDAIKGVTASCIQQLQLTAAIIADDDASLTVVNNVAVIKKLTPALYERSVPQTRLDRFLGRQRYEDILLNDSKCTASWRHDNGRVESEFTLAYYQRGYDRPKVTEFSMGRQVKDTAIGIGLELGVSKLRGGSIGDEGLAYVYCQLTGAVHDADSSVDPRIESFLPDGLSIVDMVAYYEQHGLRKGAGMYFNLDSLDYYRPTLETGATRRCYFSFKPGENALVENQQGASNIPVQAYLATLQTILATIPQ